MKEEDKRFKKGWGKEEKKEDKGDKCKEGSEDNKPRVGFERKKKKEEEGEKVFKVWSKKGGKKEGENKRGLGRSIKEDLEKEDKKEKEEKGKVVERKERSSWRGKTKWTKRWKKKKEEEERKVNLQPKGVWARNLKRSIERWERVGIGRRKVKDSKPKRTEGRAEKERRPKPEFKTIWWSLGNWKTLIKWSLNKRS